MPQPSESFRSVYRRLKERRDMLLRGSKKPSYKGKPREVVCVETSVHYPSAAEAGRVVGVHPNRIGDAIRKACSIKSTDGNRYHFRFADEPSK